MLTFSHNPYDGRIYHREAKTLARHGYHVTVLSLSDTEREKIVCKNINVKYIKVVTKNIYFSFFAKLYRLFREAVKVNADVYHCHEPESHIVGVALKILRRKKLVLDVHEYYKDLVRNGGGRFYGYFYLISCCVIEPLFCRMDDYIICADEEVKRLYGKYNKSIISLFNYPLLKYWKLEEYKRPEATVSTNHTLVYAGDISEVRGVWSMLLILHELVQMFPDVKLVLIGSIASSELKTRIDNFIESKKLKDRVSFFGQISYRDLSLVLQTASIGLLMYEPFAKFFKNIPTKQYEYAASGNAIVGSDLPPIRNFVETNKCGTLVQPGNIKEAVDAISHLYNFPDELILMSNNGRRIVHEKLNWGIEEHKLLNIYKTLF